MSTGMFDPNYHTCIPQPCVIFVVGIATEDGVFLSGIHSRFEVGHGYPTNERDAQLDMSSACITASSASASSSSSSLQNNSNNASVTNVNANGATSGDDDEDGDMDEDDDDDDEDDGEDDSSDNSSSASCLPHPDEIVRGVSGPGHWHVYTCVFDGDRSALRVDGRAESSYQHASCGDHPNNDTDGSSSSVGDNMLDGLTLGSDHQFFMTLCAGHHGVDVNGGTINPGQWTGSGSNGAIAEVAVFHGLRAMEDILRLERYFLVKYDKVPDLERVSLDDVVREEEWRRQSCALMEQPPQRMVSTATATATTVEESKSNVADATSVVSVPLRIAARHGIVAWHRNDPVTGKVIPVSRIGSKSVGSSDW